MLWCSVGLENISLNKFCFHSSDCFQAISILLISDFGCRTRQGYARNSRDSSPWEEMPGTANPRPRAPLASWSEGSPQSSGPLGRVSTAFSGLLQDKNPRGVYMNLVPGGGASVRGSDRQSRVTVSFDPGFGPDAGHFGSAPEDSLMSFKKPLWPCDQCEKTFTSQQMRKFHIEAVHENVTYTCVCGKVYKYPTALSRHQRDCVAFKHSVQQ